MAEFKCIANFYMIGGEQSFTKGYTYHGYHTPDTEDGYDYVLTNDQEATHYMTADLMSIHFKEAS